MQPLRILEKSTSIYFDHVTLLIEQLCISLRMSPSRIYEVGTYLMGKFFVLILLIHGRSFLAYNMAYIEKKLNLYLKMGCCEAPRSFGLKWKHRTLKAYPFFRTRWNVPKLLILQGENLQSTNMDGVKMANVNKPNGHTP